MKPIGTLLCAALGIAALVVSASVTPSVRLVYNPTNSAPHGWYRVTDARALQVGDYVLARLPDDAAALAAQRGYLPRQVPILKHIAAMSPQQVCLHDGLVAIDGVTAAAVLSADGQRRPLPAWRHCRRLAAGELFLLNPARPASFDSRYFGPVAAASVIGRALPLWTWGTP